MSALSVRAEITIGEAGTTVLFMRDVPTEVQEFLDKKIAAIMNAADEMMRHISRIEYFKKQDCNCRVDYLCLRCSTLKELEELRDSCKV